MAEDIRQVTEVAALKALAHPLRVRMLGALRIDGPATATQLARKFDTTSGTTSYHLRQLAKYAFVEEDPEQPSARDRRWRAVHRYTSWTNSAFAGEPEGREATRFMRRRQREFIASTAERFEDEIGTWSPDWIDAASQSDDVVQLTAASARELDGRIGELVREYTARDVEAADAGQVALFWSMTPVRGYQA